MAKFVKVILFLLLAVALHGVAGNVFTEKHSRYEQAPGDIQKKEVEARAAKIDTLDV